MSFQRTFSGAPWEESVCYCRALRAGNVIYVTGTAPVEPDGTVHAPGNGLAQAQRCLSIIQNALAQLGAGLDRVVRTRMYTTDIGRWKEYAQAHREAFQEHPPTTTLVEVSRLIHTDMLIEIEAEAVVEPDELAQATPQGPDQAPGPPLPPPPPGDPGSILKRAGRKGHALMISQQPHSLRESSPHAPGPRNSPLP